MIARSPARGAARVRRLAAPRPPWRLDAGGHLRRADLRDRAAAATGAGCTVVEHGGDGPGCVRDGVTLAPPFLDLLQAGRPDGRGRAPVDRLPPRTTRRSRLFYASTLTPSDANPGAAPNAPIAIREYRRSANPDVAVPTGPDRAARIPHGQETNHYGGTVAFGPDGRLYIATGDGAAAATRRARRAEPEQPARQGPADRPATAGTAPLRRARPATPSPAATPGDDLIWAYGLRNPFRFSFDRLYGGALRSATSARTRWRRSTTRPARRGAGRGANFGWDDCEGNLAPEPVTGTAARSATPAGARAALYPEPGYPRR